ncbi:hypothetical protein KEM56_003984 [Ascosphaera pollenicola]|nr:hypothetical protein KEM56_003984 [Ascosphaera pollenicola]
MTPPLEGDEEEFTRTATSVRERTTATHGSGASRTPQRSLPPSRITLDGESDAMEGMDLFDMSLMGGHDHGQGGPNSFSSSASSAVSDIDDARKSTTVQNDDVFKTDASASAATSTSTDPQGTPTNGRSILSHGLDSNAADVTKKPITSIFDSSTPLKRPISAVDVVDFETWDDLRNPETVDVDELDEYFKQYS